MISEENMAFLRAEGRRYIVGTPKSMLKPYEQDLITDDWNGDTHPDLAASCHRRGAGAAAARAL